MFLINAFPDTTLSHQPTEPQTEPRLGQVPRCSSSPAWPGWWPWTGWLTWQLPSMRWGHPIPQRSCGKLWQVGVPHEWECL